MNTKPIFPLILSLSFLLSLYASTEALTGDWRPITDVKDPHVVKIGEYAVSEYDKRSQSGLKFVTVVRGETQVVAGTNYRLVVAVDDGASKNYEAIVWEKPWEKFINLTSFKPTDNGRFL